MSKNFSCKFKIIVALSAICLISILIPKISFAAFVDNGNGTVTDSSANLMWQKATFNDGQAMFSATATAYCENLVLPAGGYSDWRLPKIDELKSLISNISFFPDTKTDQGYWSSSSTWDPLHAAYITYYLLSFNNGQTISCTNAEYADPYCPSYVRCVRSAGQSANKFKVWIDKNSNGVYDSGEEVVSASVRVNNETADRGVTDSQGIIQLQNITNDAKIYAQKIIYSMNNPKAGDANFANNRSYNPYYAGSVSGKMYDFVMASDIRVADGTYYDFPGQGRTLQNAAKDSQGNILLQLVHPKIGWNLIVAFEEAQSAAFYDKIRSGFRSYADYSISPFIKQHIRNVRTSLCSHFL